MKANAPEKIYVDSEAIGDDISTTVHTKRQDYPTCTEYIRTDAFVEKACEWLEIHTFSELNLDFGHSLQIKEFVDRFKEYMKGE